MKRPLDVQHSANFRDRSLMFLPYKRQMALVVSSSCSNFRENYIAVAPVQPLSNLTQEQLAALLTDEPPALEGGDYAGYDLDHLRLVPIPGVLEDGPNRHQVAFLNRPYPFWGDCSDLRVQRVARMSAAGRRLLRLNLQMLWARFEEEDAEELEALGLPRGFRLPAGE